MKNAIAILVLALFASVGVSQTIYNSTVSPLPGNLPSLGVEAYSFNQLGDGIKFIGTSSYKVRSVTVTMSSWACETGSWDKANCVTTPGAKFSVPITLKVYDVSGAPTLLDETETFQIPYRPSTDTVNCTGGRWFDGKTCFNGLATNITFEFPIPLTLPNSVVFGISYNSDNSGPAPLHGTGSPTDSLNIALAPSVAPGKQIVTGGLYWDTRYAGFTCNPETWASGVFALDSTCWGGLIPAIKFVGSATDACKDGVWETQGFKNQGDCIQSVNTGK